MNEELTESELKEIKEAFEDVKKGRLYKIEDVAKEYGVQLE